MHFLPDKQKSCQAESFNVLQQVKPDAGTRKILLTSMVPGSMHCCASTPEPDSLLSLIMKCFRLWILQTAFTILFLWSLTVVHCPIYL